MVFRPDCEGGVATNRSSAPTFYMSPMLLFVLRIVFCFTTVCRVPDVRMTRARDYVLAGLHATRDVCVAAPPCCIIRVLFVWTELTR